MGTNIISNSHAPRNGRTLADVFVSAFIPTDDNKIPKTFDLNTPKVLKTAAMIVAAPRYVGLMLFLSGFVFRGWLLDAMHIAEAAAGLSLAVLEGFALSYILSRRQLGFSKLDKFFVYIVVAVLLILLPLCATPYLWFLFDGTQLFVDQQNNFVAALFKFIWIAATASMPILIVIGVALVEKDPTDVAISLAEREAAKQQTIARIQAEAEQYVAEVEARTEQILLEHRLSAKQTKAEYRTKEQQVEQNEQKVFVCEHCNSAFSSVKTLAGHTGHCKARQELAVSSNGRNA